MWVRVPLWAPNTKNKYIKNLKTANYILENTPKEVIKIEMQMKNGREDITKMKRKNRNLNI